MYLDGGPGIFRVDALIASMTSYALLGFNRLFLRVEGEATYSEEEWTLLHHAADDLSMELVPAIQAIESTMEALKMEGEGDGGKEEGALRGGLQGSSRKRRMAALRALKEKSRSRSIHIGGDSTQGTSNDSVLACNAMRETLENARVAGVVAVLWSGPMGQRVSLNQPRKSGVPSLESVGKCIQGAGHP